MVEEERIFDGKGVVYRRNGTFYVRLRVGPNKYKHRSLKTGNKAVAVKAAEKLCYELEFKALRLIGAYFPHRLFTRR